MRSAVAETHVGLVMHKRKRFYRVLIGITLAFCVSLFGAAATKAESPQENPNTFRRQLLNRSELYRRSIQSRAAQWSPELRDRIEKQTQQILDKGFSKIDNPSKLIRKQRFAAADTDVIAEFFRRSNDWHSRCSTMKVAGFLASNFYQPSEWDVAVRTALPARYQWERRFGVLAAHSPFAGSVFDFFGFTALGGREMIVTPSSPRDHKTLTLLFGQTLLLTLFDPCDNNDFHRIDDENLLSGFCQIAQTIVLRI